MKKKAPKPIHDYYSKLGKKSAEKRAKRLIEEAKELSTIEGLQEVATNDKVKEIEVRIKK